MLRISSEIITIAIILIQIHGYNCAYICPVVSFSNPYSDIYVNSSEIETIKIYYNVDCTKIRELYLYWKLEEKYICYFSNDSSPELKISNITYTKRSAGNMGLIRVTNHYLEFNYSLNSNIYNDFLISLKLNYTISCNDVTYIECEWYEFCPTNNAKIIRLIIETNSEEQKVVIDVKNQNIKPTPPESLPAEEEIPEPQPEEDVAEIQINETVYIVEEEEVILSQEENNVEENDKEKEIKIILIIGIIMTVTIIVLLGLLCYYYKTKKKKELQVYYIKYLFLFMFLYSMR